ncbi:MAG: hypothetical protein QM820_09800 [Minicystis sp.]
MRRSLLAVLACVALAAGCQLVAGVHNDAVLATGGAGGHGTGSSTSAGGGAPADGGPCTPASCTDGVCLSGACVHPKCEPHGLAFDVLTPAEVSNHKIDTHMAAVSSGTLVHVGVVDPAGSKLFVRSIQDGGNPIGGMAEVALPMGGGVAFADGWVDGGEVVFAGRMVDKVGEARFPLGSSGVTANGMTAPYPALPAECTSPNELRDAYFARSGAKTQYVALCQNTGRTLIAGDDTSSPVIAASGTLTDGSLRLQSYASAGGAQLLTFGDPSTGGAWTRSGTTAAALATAAPLHMTSDTTQRVAVLGAAALPTADGITLIAAEYTPTPVFKGTLWSGVLTDSHQARRGAPARPEADQEHRLDRRRR